MIRKIYLGVIVLISLFSIWLKTTAPDRISYLKFKDKYMAAATSAFERSGFITISQDGQTLTVMTPTCMVTVAPSLVDGQNDSIFMKNHNTDGQVTFVYHGDIYANRPNFSIFLGQIIERASVMLGNNYKRGPVWAVAISRECNRETTAEIYKTLNEVNY